MIYGNRQKEAGSDSMNIRSCFEDLMEFPNEIFRGYSIPYRYERPTLINGEFLTHTRNYDLITRVIRK